MQNKRVPFIVSSVFQLMKLVFVLLTVLFYLNKTADSILNLIFSGGDLLSLSIILLSGEFALFAALAIGILYPEKIIKTGFLIKLFKLFSLTGVFILLVFTFISRITAGESDYEVQVMLNGKILFLIALIFIDFAVLFVLVLYKGEFDKKSDNENQRMNFPEYVETKLEE